MFQNEGQWSSSGSEWLIVGGERRNGGSVKLACDFGTSFIWYFLFLGMSWLDFAADSARCGLLQSYIRAKGALLPKFPIPTCTDVRTSMESLRRSIFFLLELFSLTVT